MLTWIVLERHKCFSMYLNAFDSVFFVKDNLEINFQVVICDYHLKITYENDHVG